MGDFQKTEGQVAAVIGERLAQARHRKCLTRWPTDEKIEPAECLGAGDEVVGGHVTKVGRLRMARGQHFAGEGLDLGAPEPVEVWGASFGRTDARKAGGCAHGQRMHSLFAAVHDKFAFRSAIR
jgi:hypothetical protein